MRNEESSFDYLEFLKKDISEGIYDQIKNNSKFGDKSGYVYVLRLEDGRYYVGESNSLRNRLIKHFVQGGHPWTIVFRPIEVAEIIPTNNNLKEEKATAIRYAKKYGIENVRGSCHFTFILSVENENRINRAVLAELGYSVEDWIKFAKKQDRKNLLYIKEKCNYSFSKINCCLSVYVSGFKKETETTVSIKRNIERTIKSIFNPTIRKKKK